MRPEVTVVETSVTNLADGLALVLVIIAEHAIRVNLAHRQVAGEVPLSLHLGEILPPVVPDADLVPGEVAGQSAAGEDEDCLTDEAPVVGVLHGHRVTVRHLVVGQVHAVLL